MRAGPVAWLGGSPGWGWLARPQSVGKPRGEDQRQALWEGPRAQEAGSAVWTPGKGEPRSECVRQIGASCPINSPCLYPQPGTVNAPICKLYILFIPAFVWEGVANGPEDQPTRCSLGSPELCPLPQHPEFHSQGPAEAGNLTAPSGSQQALFCAHPQPNGLFLPSPTSRNGGRDGSSPACSSQACPPSTGKSGPDYWGRGMGESGG